MSNKELRFPVVVRKDIWHGNEKRFFLDDSFCCLIDRGSAWRFNSSRLRVSLFHQTSGRHGGRDVVEVIARELLNLRFSLPSLYSMLEIDYATKHAALGGLSVTATLDALWDETNNTQDYETSFRNHGACELKPGKCYSPFHCGVSMSAEKITPVMREKCYTAFFKHRDLINHPRGYIAAGVPKYAFIEAARDFRSFCAEARKREQAKAMKSIEDVLSEHWEFSKE